MLRLGLVASMLLLVTASASGAKTASNPLVGTWTRINSCTAFVEALDRAGLAAEAPEWLAGGGYFRAAAQVDPNELCKGARNLRHSHFFTASGAFGSYDQNRNQVDDGDYKIIAPHTLAFPSHTRDFGYKITVHYTIIEGRLRFAVVDTEALHRQVPRRDRLGNLRLLPRPALHPQRPPVTLFAYRDRRA